MCDRIMLATMLVIIYYGFFKILLRHPAYYAARLFGLMKKFTVEEAKGAVGFGLVVISHLFFAGFLVQLFQIPWSDLGLKNVTFNYLELGFLLGLGMAGSSAIFSLLIVKMIAYLSRYSEDQLFLSLSSGWLKSYEYTRKLLPLRLFIPIVVLQLGCEEVIFRGVFLHYFYMLGNATAIFISSLLFTLMQFFQMPTLRSCLFPAIGGMIMGFVHGYLFLMTHSLWPLILSHSVFFMLLAT